MTCDVQLFSQVRSYLMSCNDENLQRGQRKPDAFILFQFPSQAKHKYDEVYPGVFLGDRTAAEDKRELKSLGITLVVNAAQGSKFNQINTNAEFYTDVDMKFHPIPALDIMTYKINKYFKDAAEAIDKCLLSKGKVFVHCQQGISRSAAIVLAFLMIKRDMDVMQAVKSVRAKREIFPNEGFLKQLCELDEELHKAC
ncbi:dual specificity protein phosphatase 3-like [Gigantopelta aegis]|uniref:dual specificity protein phosphatase 3-like n=1 Tax=Gigantopelta aegis TaxID=1735272 RepID=UPI001B88CA54|nr:dual specificity protein phosphatase 3-like [Gigantopelta aegis]